MEETPTTDTTTTTQVPSAAERRAKHLWAVTGTDLLLYVVFHVLSMLLKGVPDAFAGREDTAMWTWTIMLSITFLPTLISALGKSRIIGWIVFVLGILTVLFAVLMGYQYGIRSGAGYIALTVAVFVLVPSGFALVNTLRWARGE